MSIYRVWNEMNNNIRKALFYSFIAVMAITMITSNQLSIYASPTTEDDGWREGDYEGSLEEQEEQAQEDWEDAGRPGDGDDSGNGNDDDGPNPYCDKVPDNYHGVCHDRKDYYQSGPKNGLNPCNDGTDKADWRDCKDATKNNENNGNDNDNDIPECVNGVTQECVISVIGLILALDMILVVQV